MNCVASSEETDSDKKNAGALEDLYNRLTPGRIVSVCTFNDIKHKSAAREAYFVETMSGKFNGYEPDEDNVFPFRGKDSLGAEDEDGNSAHKPRTNKQELAEWVASKIPNPDAPPVDYAAKAKELEDKLEQANEEAAKAA